MAPHIERIRTTIRTRIAAAIERKEWDVPTAAEKIGVKRVTILRWTDGTRKDKSVPSLDDARRAADALGVSLDYLTGHELTAAQTVEAIAGRVERETETMRLRLDELLADLSAARTALISRDESQVETAVVAGVGKQAGKQRGKSVTVPREATS